MAMEGTKLQIALAYNPATSTSRLARIAALGEVLESNGHTLSWHNSLSFDCAGDAPEADLVCVCGGDGTAAMVVAAQADRSALPPLAVFPCGTINLLARELGYSKDPNAFAARIGNGSPLRSNPLALAAGRPFLACASIGADALAVAGLSEPLKARIGRLAYVVALARHLWSWPRPRMTVTADGAQFAAEALFVLRGSFYAGPWMLDRRARLGSEDMHVLALPRARRRDLMALALYAMGGARRLPRGWMLMPAREVTVSGAATSPVQADGDIIGALPVSFTMSDERLRWI